MSIAVPTFMLAIQFGLNAAASWMQLRSLKSLETAGLLEKWTAWGLIFLANIAGLGLALGAIQGLGAPGFLGGHGVIVAVLAVCRRRELGRDWAELRSLIAQSRAQLTSDPWLAAIVAVVGMLGVLAAMAQPVVYDALAYRMSRIGAWLQSGQIAFLDADDPRLNYMPYLPDLTMAWLIAWFAEGYVPAALGQWGGGCLLLLATAGLAREAGLTRWGARFAVMLVLTMSNVVDQFTAAHTDLYTAGICAAAFHLGLWSLRRGSAPWFGAAALGMAVGCKGTMFYFSPALVLWILLLGRCHRLTVKAWLGTLLVGGAAVAVFAAPTYWRNAQHYDSPLGPRELVEMHHQGAAGPAAWLRKSRWNLQSTLVQWFDPNSQPLGLQTGSRRVGEWLMGGLPAHDEFTYEKLSRTETLRGLLGRENPDADLTSPGIIALGLFLAGWGVAGLRRQPAPAARMLRDWGTGIAVFFVFYHFTQQWHPYGFRYFVLAAPWLAVVGASWLDWAGPRKMGRVFEWGVAAAAISILWSANTKTHQSGWRAVAHAENFAGFLAYSGWREWLDALETAEPVTVSLPLNRPLAAFYRRVGEPKVRLTKIPTEEGLTAEQWVADGSGWKLLPPGRFFGREGRVQARIWLFGGDPNSPYSIVAFRRLQPAEQPVALVYRQQWVAGDKSPGHLELLVRSWEAKLKLRLENSGPVSVQFRVSTPREERSGVLTAGRETQIELATLDDEVAQVLVHCSQPTLRVQTLP